MAHRRRRRLLTLSIAGCGVLVGHWLTYLVDAPDASARTALLDATGHGYLTVAGELTSAFLAFSIVAAFLGALLPAGGGARPRRSLAARMVLLQVGAFAAMEIVERVVAGSPLGDLVGGGVLAVGSVANVAVALLGAALLRRVLALADRVAGIASADTEPAVRPPTAVVALAPFTTPRPRHRGLAAAPVRGPPSPSCP